MTTRIFLTLPLLLLMACAGETTTTDEDVIGDDDDVTEDALRKGAAEQWVYNGTLPHLEEPKLTVSLTAHTARITGFVPAGWSTPLPYYADSVVERGRTKIAVVYPIATGSEVNSQGTAYEINRVSPWVPTNSKAAWGGFPFVPYNRGIAFHGPITASDGEWKLARGPVSHGCNRMQGEHIVELAHLIGVDMTTTVHRGDSWTGLRIPVTVLRKADEWRGKQVDVDYRAEPSVRRPSGPNVQVFPSWSADDLATFVCPLNKRALAGSPTIPANYCARRYQNKFDPARGPAR